MCPFQELGLKQCLQNPTTVLRGEMAGTKCFYDCTSLCLPERQHPELSEITLQGLGSKVSKNMGHSLVTVMTHFAILRFDPAASITGFC